MLAVKTGDAPDMKHAPHMKHPSRRRLLLLPAIAAVALLSGCVTYGYRDGHGDYYYGQPSTEYVDPYGYGGYGYGYPDYGYGYGGSYWSGSFGYYGGYYGGYHGPYRPPHHGGGHGHGNDHDHGDHDGDTGNNPPPPSNRPDRPRAPWRDLDNIGQPGKPNQPNRPRRPEGRPVQAPPAGNRPAARPSPPARPPVTLPPRHSERPAGAARAERLSGGGKRDVRRNPAQ
jgi:hypothetical protein